jgi:type VII secretion protein EccB
MRTRREQHQAYRFLTRRIVSALLSGEPETTELPMRRFAFSVFGSVVVAILVFAGFGVYGLLVPGGGQPAENVIIVERETGAKYLFLQGQLHPVLNWASARLILGQATPTVRTMSQTSLRDVPRGRPVGILNAPDALPAASALLGLPWSVCSAPRSPASVTLATHVFVGQTLAAGEPLGAGVGLLVSVGGGTERYLVWRDHRLRVASNATIVALNWASVRPAPVGEAFLNALPAGPDLAPIALPEVGLRAQPSIAGAPTVIGQLFRAGGQHYVMLRNGLTPVGEVAALLWAAGGQRINEISAQEVGRVLVDTKVEPPGLPVDVPAARGSDERFGMACAVYRGSTDVDRPVTVETFARVGPELTLTDQAAIPGAGADGVVTADRVALQGGHAALVSALTPPGATSPGNLYLITDQGIKYPLPQTDTDKVRASLGYGDAKPVAVPGSILALVPTGAALDPRVAALFAAPATVGPSVPSGPIS